MRWTWASWARVGVALFAGAWLLAACGARSGGGEAAAEVVFRARGGIAAGGGGRGVPAEAQTSGGERVAVGEPLVVVYKSASCGCCGSWVEHLRRSGFRVETRDTMDMVAVKAALGLPERLWSCHTATVGGYVIEGHVPGDLVRRLLTERADVAGLAVPGMPVGSPGMEGPSAQPYDVIAFRRDGTTEVYARR